MVQRPSGIKEIGVIVLWDRLFDTCVNPATFEASCGFDPEKEKRLLEMQAYRDVHRDKAAPPAGL
jgi:hypothetical protein